MRLESPYFSPPLTLTSPSRTTGERKSPSQVLHTCALTDPLLSFSPSCPDSNPNLNHFHILFRHSPDTILFTQIRSQPRYHSVHIPTSPHPVHQNSTHTNSVHIETFTPICSHQLVHNSQFTPSYSHSSFLKTNPLTTNSLTTSPLTTNPLTTSGVTMDHAQLCVVLPQVGCPSG